MKQKEIDRWMRHQARRNPQPVLHSINWALVMSVLVIGVAVLFLLLKLIHTA